MTLYLNITETVCGETQQRLVRTFTTSRAKAEAQAKEWNKTHKNSTAKVAAI